MNAKTALVVDDSKSARFAMRKFLESFGYQVDTAESAEDAYIYLRKKLPEVMFLDHIMPGTDGFEAIKAIKQNALTAGLPVVLCSSNEGDDFDMGDDPHAEAHAAAMTHHRAARSQMTTTAAVAS